MKILLIAPESSNIDSISEIRTLSGMHRVQTLNGTVTTQDVYQAARGQQIDALHFASHSGPAGIQLSGDEVLSPEDIVTVSKLAEASLVFFNGCNTGKLASYATAHGIPYAIFANMDIPEFSAWKFPLAFYEYIEHQNGHEKGSIDYPLAFSQSGTGQDGTYGFAVSLEALLSRPEQLALDELDQSLQSINDLVRLLARTLRLSIIANLVLFSVIFMLLFLHSSGVY